MALAALAACRGEPQSQEIDTSTADEPAIQDAVPESGDSRPGDDSGAGINEPARRQEHAVFRLGDNRLLAHFHAGGALHIPAGSAGFAKYVRFGLPSLRWQLGQDQDGVPVAVPERLASMEVPLTAAQASSVSGLTVRVYAPARQRLGIKVNGGKVSGPAFLDQGWQTLTLPMAQERFTAGDNIIAFEPSRGQPPAIAWIRLEHGDSMGASDEEASAREHGVASAGYGTIDYDADTDAFAIPEGDGLTFYVYLPETAHLVADVAPDCRVDVSVEADAHTGKAPVQGQLSGRGARIDLGALAGQVVRLELTARGCARALLQHARVTISGAPGASGVSGASGIAGAPVRVRGDGMPPRYIILWVMDTLRADRVRPFEPRARPEVPSFERLAETGTVFRQYWVEGNESQTSHASVWTSLYPANHNVRTAGNGGTWQLSRPFARLPALLDEAGFHTIGVTANGFVTKHGGYGRNFDVWRNLMREGAAMNGNVPAARILDLGLEYMAEKYQEEPVFLFLGSIDTHKPWIAHEPWLSRYDPERYDGVHQRAAWPKNLGMTQGSMECVQVPEPRDLARINAIYDSDVSYQDQQLGRLIDQLEAWGIADQTMIIVTADHGEELWEVGRCGHGASLRETLVWVPLLIHYPPLFHARVVEQGADGVDLLPTILDALDLPELDAAQGHSLIPLAQGAMTAMAGYPMPSYASQYEYAHAMRVANWKARVARSAVPELYDLAEDPGELVNVAAQRPIARRFMSDVLSTFLIYRQRWKKRLWGVASNMTARAARDLEAPSQRHDRRPAKGR